MPQTEEEHLELGEDSDSDVSSRDPEEETHDDVCHIYLTFTA